jgi:hypothetical protein
LRQRSFASQKFKSCRFWQVKWMGNATFDAEKA